MLIVLIINHYKYNKTAKYIVDLNVPIDTGISEQLGY
jgi:hypothetical protein